VGMKKILSIKWIIIFAAVLRLSFLGSAPISLNWDEISMGYTAYSVGATGRDEWGELLPIFFRSYGEWKSAVYIYLLVPFIKVLGLNAWAVRLPSALAGIGAVYLIYLLGKRLYSEKVGLWSALLIAVTPWHLVLSRPAFEANVSLTLLLLGIYGFVRAWQTHWQWQGLALSLIGFGLAPHTYNSGKIVVPFLVLYLVVATKFYKSIKNCALYFGVLAVFALPILLNMATGRAQYRYTQVGVTTDQSAVAKFYDSRKTFPLPELANKILFNQGTFFVYKVVDNWLSYFDPSFLFIEAGDHRQHHVPYRGVLYLVEGLFIVYGLKVLSSRAQSRDLSSRFLHFGRNDTVSLKFLPFVIIALGFLPGALTRDSEHVLRTILAIPGFVLLAAVGVDYLQNNKNLGRLFTYSLYFLTFEIFTFLVMYFAWYPRLTASDWQYGHKQVAIYLQQHEAEYDKIIMTKWFGEPQLFLAFYNKWDPVWYQQENKKLISYEGDGRLWLDQLPEYSFGKYTFRYLNWQSESRAKNTLYISKWDDFYQDSDYQGTIKYPDGSIAFQLVRGDK